MSEAPIAAELSDSNATGRHIAKVLLDSSLPQLDHLFDYAIPQHLKTEVKPGQRVKVPFRSRQRESFGYIIEITTTSDFVGELAEISSIVSPIPLLTPNIWRLARTVADRAAGSAGDILRLAIPQRLVRVEKQHVSETELPSNLEDVTDNDRLGSRLMAGERLALTPPHGLSRLDTGDWVGSWAQQLSRTALSVFRTGASVIIVVPDYRDLDQVRTALIADGHDAAIRVDSRQTNAERYAGFLRALDPVPRIIVGNRSAVYAPATNLGAILVWDDGDPVLAEPLTPYVHARDAALIRADLEQAGLLFAAHSRSAEVQRLTNIGYVQVHEQRVQRTRIIHSGSLTNQENAQGRIPEIASRILREGLAHGPVLVQVAAPGYAPLAVCARCHDIARCSECAGPIGFDRANSWACRWCGSPGAGWSCSTCAGNALEMRGAGSERTMEQLERMFPETKIVVSDGKQPRMHVDARPGVVVATRGAEPIAAGGYRALALLDADRLLNFETLRAGEDCLRWWENAAALAHPSATCVIAGGGGPIIQAMLTDRAEEWIQNELRDRKELRYPPMVRVASITGGPDEVRRAVETIHNLPGVDVLGPTEQSEGRVRAIVRFDYSTGPEIATRLRAVLVADAAGSSRSSRPEARDGTRRRSRVRPHALRLRFDDRGVFDTGGE